MHLELVLMTYCFDDLELDCRSVRPIAMKSGQGRDIQ